MFPDASCCGEVFPVRVSEVPDTSEHVDITLSATDCPLMVPDPASARRGLIWKLRQAWEASLAPAIDAVQTLEPREEW